MRDADVIAMLYQNSCDVTAHYLIWCKGNYVVKANLASERL
jgi:hypothetical protein